MHRRNGVGAAVGVSASHQSPAAIELCRLAAGLNLLEGFLVAPLSLLGTGTGRAVHHARTWRLGPAGTMSDNQ
ncbi:hypothetical protein MTX20_33790 [Bradyrhizobium sp. ISRA435]|nr:hypothetical protein MTX20_33790 [Bradyrhizobium sp. ISRA435]